MSPVLVSRLKLLLLTTLFFGPFVLAWIIYFGPADWKPGSTTAVGQLVNPARAMPEGLQFQLPDGEPEGLDELWTILHVGQGPCADPCKQRLWQTRQMRTLLHRHRARVQRAYLTADPAEAAPLWQALEAEHPRLKVLALPAEQRHLFDQWIGELPVADPVLLIDPLGNFLLYYGDELPLKGMLKDIKRVLKLSNIG